MYILSYVGVPACENPQVLRVIKYLLDLLNIVFMLVPLALIVLVSIDLIKSLIIGENKNFSLIVKRVFSAVMLFFVPTFVSILYSFISTSIAVADYNKCIDNATPTGIKYYEKYADVGKIKGKFSPVKIKLAANKAYKLAADSGSGGSYSGQTYSDLSDSQIGILAAISIGEQGSGDGAKAELSLMANLYELNGKSYGSLYNYVCSSGWFGSGRCGRVSASSASGTDIANVRDVLVNGNRTLPLYVDEHDCWFCNSKNYCGNGNQGDICYLNNNGSTISSVSGIKDRSNYKQDVTVIKNVYGSTYTFYSFPTSGSDPFGYTKASYNKIKGNS